MEELSVSFLTKEVLLDLILVKHETSFNIDVGTDVNTLKDDVFANKEL